MSPAALYLNTAHLLLRSRSNGPGLRSVVWVQGCSIRCVGCINHALWDFDARRLVSPVLLARRLCAAAPECEGLTITGGEPLDQAPAVALLAQAAQHLGRSVVLYTGYTLAALHRRNDFWVDRLLAATDILIDGPFAATRQTHDRAIGSANQRIHFLTRRYSPAVLAEPDAWLAEEWIVYADGSVWRTGIAGRPAQEEQ